MQIILYSVPMLRWFQKLSAKSKKKLFAVRSTQHIFLVQNLNCLFFVSYDDYMLGIQQQHTGGRLQSVYYRIPAVLGARVLGSLLRGLQRQAAQVL